MTKEELTALSDDLQKDRPELVALILSTTNISLPTTARKDFLGKSKTTQLRTGTFLT